MMKHECCGMRFVVKVLWHFAVASLVFAWIAGANGEFLRQGPEFWYINAIVFGIIGIGRCGCGCGWCSAKK